MLTLVSGGAASGKSEYAESLVMQSAAPVRVYLATMEVWDDEGRIRIARHRALRQRKGFKTVEAPRGLDRFAFPDNSCILLECLSNLCANECFGPEGFDGAIERIMTGILHLLDHCSDLVIVTNELFSDGITYPQETEAYLSVLGQLNRQLAAKADFVYEVVCGIPICWKEGAT